MILHDTSYPPLRQIISLMERFAGIRTFASGYVHESGQDTYVSFTADSPDALVRFVVALPLLHLGAKVKNKWHYAQCVWVEVAWDENESVWFILHCKGRTPSMQRKLIREVESSLSNALKSASQAGASVERPEG
jgi:hypothetical protein